MGRKRSKKRTKTTAEIKVTNTANEPMKVATVVFSNYLDLDDWINKNGAIPAELEAAIIRAQDETLPHQDAIKPLCDLLIEHLEEVGIIPRAAYFIRHLQDIELRTQGKAVKQRTKLPHLHMVISVNASGAYDKNATRYPISQWAEGLYCREHIVEKQKRGKDAFNNALSYLIHAKDPDKMQYQPSDVYTARGLNYLEIWYENQDRWAKGRVTKQKNLMVTPEAIDDLIFKIIDDGLTRQEMFLNREYSFIYTYAQPKIDAAFKTATEARNCQNKEDFDAGRFSTTVFYFYGNAGSGKSHIAKTFCNSAAAWAKKTFGREWRIFKAESRTPIDSYRAEEIIFLDETKQNDFLLGEWLKLLDPYEAANLHARYASKTNIVPRIIVLTTTQDPMHYFLYVKNRTAENLNQFFRRITRVIEVRNIDHVQQFDVPPSDENTECNLYKRKRLDGMRLVNIDTEEYLKQHLGDEKVNPFQPRTVRTDVTFERELYPRNLHPSAMNDLLIQNVAESHHMTYELPPDTVNNIRCSIWEYVTDLCIGLERQQLLTNPF